MVTTRMQNKSTMKLGFSLPNNQGIKHVNDLVALAVEAESMGYHSVWVSEHLFHATYVASRLGDAPYHEALTILTCLLYTSPEPTRPERIGGARFCR